MLDIIIGLKVNIFEQSLKKVEILIFTIYNNFPKNGLLDQKI